MIRTVTDAEICIGETRYSQTIALTNDEILDVWVEKPVGELVPTDFDALLGKQAEIVILGTGASNIFAPRELVFALARKNVGLEVMDTRAAARTFNVLAGEGRQVAAVLYI